MSYEHLAGLELDPRTDVYSFGVILFEALTGHHPYGTSSFAVLLGKMVTGEPTPLRTYRPDLPAGLERVITRTLHKERDQRTPSLETLIAELTPFAREPRPDPIQAPRSDRPRPNFAHEADLLRARAAAAWPMMPPPAPARHRNPASWLVAVAIVAGILVGWLLFRLR
jgi:serine/threonine-protein kinase